LKKAVVIAAILGLLALAAGWSYNTFFSGGKLAIPELKAAWHEWGVVNETVTEIRSTIIIYNPGGYSATVESLTYEVYVNDIKIAVGHLVEPARIEPKSNATIRVRTFIDNTKIPDLWVSYVTNNENLHLEVEAQAVVKAFGLTLNVPISFSKDYRPEPPLEERLDIHEEYNITVNGQTLVTVEEVDTSWGTVTNETTQLIHNITLYNPNPFPIVISRMRYVAVVNDLTIAEGEQPMANITLGPHETKCVLVYTYIDNTLLDDWWVSHVRNGEVSNVNVTVFMVLENGVLVPVYERSFTVQTDLLEAMSYP